MGELDGLRGRDVRGTGRVAVYVVRIMSESHHDDGDGSGIGSSHSSDSKRTIRTPMPVAAIEASGGGIGRGAQRREEGRARTTGCEAVR